MSIDKNALYDRFHKSCERRERLANLATRKALDLPLDEDVNITTTHNGPGPVAMVLMAAALLLGGGGAALGTMGLMGWLNDPDKLDQRAAPSHVGAQLAQPQEFEVTFTADEGTEIDVQKAD